MQYLFIVSCGHSGSTLLDMILGSHDKITSLGEVTRFRDYVENNRTCTCGKKVLECEFWSGVVDRVSSDRSPFNVSVRMTDLSGNLQKLTTLAEFLLALRSSPRLMRKVFSWLNDSRMLNSERLYEVVGQITGTRIAVDSSKSPFRAKLMYLHSPENVRVIHLVRDGRDVVASHTRKGVSARRASALWCRHWHATHMWLSTVAESRRLLVRYGHLTAKPYTEVGRICRFLGIDFQEEMLNFRGVEHHNIGGNPMRFRKEGIFHRTRTWEHRLKESELRTFELIAGGIDLPEQ